MNDNEIREAVESGNRPLVLLNLAQSYLACSGVMPEKEKIRTDVVFQDTKHNQRLDKDNKYREGFNSAIDACTLALTKKLEGLSQMIKALFENKLKIGLSSAGADKVAQAIRKYLTEEER
jgi:hypothetical protein